jgi:hypothetical protein
MITHDRATALEKRRRGEKKRVQRKMQREHQRAVQSHFSSWGRTEATRPLGGRVVTLTAFNMFNTRLGEIWKIVIRFLAKREITSLKISWLFDIFAPTSFGRPRRVPRSPHPSYGSAFHHNSCSREINISSGRAIFRRHLRLIKIEFE